MSVGPMDVIRLVVTKASIKHLVIVRLDVNRGNVIRNMAVFMQMDIKETIKQRQNVLVIVDLHVILT